MCLYPRMIRNGKYLPNKKNGGQVPPVLDERVLYVAVGCQNCIECRKQRARGWQVRLLEDIKENKNGKFITLTFSNKSIYELNKEIDEALEGYNRDNAIAKLGVRRFLERWRKEHGKSLRHWLVTEIGHKGTENIHLHGIVWTDESADMVEQIWQYGYVWKGQMVRGRLVNYVNEATVNYMTKYITKQDLQHRTFQARVLTSPGIGRNYTESRDSKGNEYSGTKTNEAYRTRTGHKIAMPVYWRNKIYSDEEREKLWLQKLDKEERWVCGEKISVKKGLGDYFKTVDWYRKLNTKLGYGGVETASERAEYERDLRKIQLMKRIEGQLVKVEQWKPILEQWEW